MTESVQNNTSECARVSGSRTSSEIDLIPKGSNYIRSPLSETRPALAEDKIFNIEDKIAARCLSLFHGCLWHHILFEKLQNHVPRRRSSSVVGFFDSIMHGKIQERKWSDISFREIQFAFAERTARLPGSVFISGAYSKLDWV